MHRGTRHDNTTDLMCGLNGILHLVQLNLNGRRHAGNLTISLTSCVTVIGTFCCSAEETLLGAK